MQVHAGTVNEEVVLDDCFSTSAYNREKARGMCWKQKMTA
jgi:hypothetical protein